jgi:hypothetical protein
MRGLDVFDAESSVAGFEKWEAVIVGATVTLERGLAVVKVCLRNLSGAKSSSFGLSCIDCVRFSLLPPFSPRLDLCIEDCEEGGGVGYGIGDSS